MTFLLFALAWTSAASAAATATDASRVRLTPPATVVELDASRLRGTPWRLAWSAEEDVFYLQVYEAEDDTRGVYWHYLVDAETGALRAIPEEPSWAVDYWTWKSAQHPPGRPDSRIDVEIKRKQLAPMTLALDGGLARGGSTTANPGNGQVAQEAAMAAISSRQWAVVCTLTYRGHLLGEWVNRPVIPGHTFGWAPAGIGLLAYSDPEGALLLMDDRGRTRRVKGARSTLLPAWSGDGTRLAFLERGTSRRFRLKLVELTRS